MRHIHTSIVSKQLATRVNNTILRTPTPHISSSEEMLSRLTYFTLAQLRTNKSPFLKSSSQSILTQSRRQNTSITTMSPLSHSHTNHHFNCTHIVTHEIVDRPRRSHCTAVQVDREDSWWSTRWKIGLPPLAKVMGVGRQQHNSQFANSKRMTTIWQQHLHSATPDMTYITLALMYR